MLEVSGQLHTAGTSIRCNNDLYHSQLAERKAAQGTRYAEGLLFGTVIRRQGTETGDAHEQRTTTHREAGKLDNFLHLPL